MTPRRVVESIARIFTGVQRERCSLQPSGVTDDFDQLVSRADACRERRDWIAAEDYYRRALELRPERAAIWIQRGHALKESGNGREGLACYLHADRLDPSNSDTALQIGHVYKLLASPGDAVTWYERAARCSPCQLDAITELEHLGYPTGSLRYLMDHAEPDRSGESEPNGPRQRIVFWDVSALSEDGRADRVAGLLADWSRALLDSMATALPIRTCCLDPDTLSWRANPAPHVPGGSLDCDSHVSRIIQDHGGADKIDTVLVLPVLPTDTPIARRRFASDILRNTYHVRHLLLVPPLAAVSAHPDLHASPLTREWSEPRRLCDELLGLGDAILSASPRENASGWEALNAHVIHLDRVRDTPSEGGEATTAGGHDRCRMSDLVIMPEDADELRHVLAAYRSLAEPRVLRLAATYGSAPTPRIAADGAEEADGLRVAGVTRSDAVAALPSTAVVLVPASCPEQALWTELAAEAGARVIVASRPDSLPIRSTFVTMLPDFNDTAQLAARWQHVARHSADDDHVRGRWLPKLNQALDACVRPSAVLRRLVQIGDFHSLAPRGGGLALRASSNWQEPAAHGSVLDGEAAALRLTVRPYSRSPLRIAFLVGSSEGSGNGVRARVAIDGIPTETFDLRIPSAAWGWITVTQSLSRRIDPYVIDVTLQVTPQESCRGELRVAIGGIFLYHEGRDHVWFEFLERASRGEVPEIRSMRTWSQHASFQAALANKA